MRKRFPGGHRGPNRYPHCKVSDSGHLCFWDTKLATWVPMFRLTNAQLLEWMKSVKVLDAGHVQGEPQSSSAVCRPSSTVGWYA
jgi:hypothetical protein